MSTENKLRLSDFVQEDRFELNSYLTYLFHQFYRDASGQLDEGKVRISSI